MLSRGPPIEETTQPPSALGLRVWHLLADGSHHRPVTPSAPARASVLAGGARHRSESDRRGQAVVSKLRIDDDGLVGEERVPFLARHVPEAEVLLAVVADDVLLSFQRLVDGPPDAIDELGISDVAVHGVYLRRPPLLTRPSGTLRPRR